MSLFRNSMAAAGFAGAVCLAFTPTPVGADGTSPILLEITEPDGDLRTLDERGDLGQVGFEGEMTGAEEVERRVGHIVVKHTSP
ncbi:hypothetical protein AB4Z09_07940 [Rhodococcus sp. TAF43]|jgi:hypothetical protein|uniref:hypothetical protein n=1 Tax=Rhodococcus sp. TAF43 TaxID=3237483 RepID=UPI003F9E429B